MVNLILKNKYSTYAISEIISKLIVTMVTIGSFTFLDPHDFTQMNLALSWIGLLAPIFICSADVTIVRYIKEATSNVEYRNLLFKAHFKITVVLFTIFLLLLSFYNTVYANFSPLEVTFLLIYICVLSYYTVEIKVLLFELSFVKACVLSILPNLLLVLGVVTLFLLEVLAWQERLLLPFIGFAIALLLTKNYRHSNKTLTERSHYSLILSTAKWLTPQMLFSALYIYGDRILASFYLTETDLSNLLFVAQCSFLLSFLNRLLNTFWQTEIFNNRGSERSGFGRIITLALGSYLIAFLVISAYYHFIIGDGSKNLIKAFSIYSLGFFFQVYYHLSNSSLLWGKLYSYQFFISISSGTFALLLGFALYDDLPWFYFGIVFCLTTMIQFLIVNVALLKSGQKWNVISKRVFYFLSVCFIYYVAILSVSSVIY